MAEHEVRVVFSDGSKALAHNLDDLYERWVERRRAMGFSDEEIPSYGKIDYTVPPSEEVARKWKLNLVGQLSEIDLELSKLKRLDSKGRPYVIGKDKPKRDLLLAEKYYLVASVATLNDYFRENAPKSYAEVMREAGEEGDFPRLMLVDAVKLLHKLAAEGRVKYSPEEDKLINGIDRFLRKKGK